MDLFSGLSVPDAGMDAKMIRNSPCVYHFSWKYLNKEEHYGNLS